MLKIIIALNYGFSNWRGLSLVPHSRAESAFAGGSVSCGDDDAWFHHYQLSSAACCDNRANRTNRANRSTSTKPTS